MEEIKLFKGEFNQIGKLWNRQMALLTDYFILLLPTVLIYFIFLNIVSGGNLMNLLYIPEPEQMKLFAVYLILFCSLDVLYFTYFIGKTGQTPGKKSMSLKVVNSEGNIIGCGKAFLRHILFIFYGGKGIGCLIYIISAIVGGFDKQKRTLHDRICGTFVVSKEIDPAIEKIRRGGKTRMSGTAIFAFILSIVCFVIPAAGQLICFYVSGRAIYDIKHSNGLLKGKFLAVAAIVISIVYLMALAGLLLNLVLNL